MGSSAEHFDSWFKERLEHFEERPREAAWENIAEKLGHTRKKSLMVFIFRIAAGMALTLSLGLGYYYYTQHRVISVPPSPAENLHPLHQSQPDEIKMAAAINSKVLPETVSSLSGISSAVQSENFPVLIAGPAGISGQVIITADSVHENKPVLSGPADPLAGAFAEPALRGRPCPVPSVGPADGTNCQRTSP